MIWRGSAAGLLRKAGHYHFLPSIPKAERLARRGLYEMQASGINISDLAIRAVADARTQDTIGVGAVSGVMEPSNPLTPDGQALAALALAQAPTDSRLKLAGRTAFLFEQENESELVLFPADNAFIMLNSKATSKVLLVGAALGRVLEDLPVNA